LQINEPVDEPAPIFGLSLIFATGTVKFRVKACNATGCSGWSGYASVTLHSELGLMSQPAESATVSGSIQ